MGVGGAWGPCSVVTLAEPLNLKALLDVFLGFRLFGMRFSHSVSGAGKRPSEKYIYLFLNCQLKQILVQVLLR